MHLKDYLHPNDILQLPQADKQTVLDRLGDILAARLEIDAADLREAIWAREALMSTGIGGNIGVPHVRYPDVDRAAMAVAVCPAGVNGYESIDNSPVHIVVLIVAPAGEHELYIRLLARVADTLRHPECREALLAADTIETIYSLLLDEEH